MKHEQNIYSWHNMIYIYMQGDSLVMQSKDNASEQLNRYT